jgi:hypothetical protein
MPYTKVTDIAYGRLQAPSLDQQEEFLVNFGMVRVERTKDALYMRGTDPNHQFVDIKAQYSNVGTIHGPG